MSPAYEARVRDLGLTLPPAPKPMAKYRTGVLIGGLLHLSGHGPLRPDGTMITGRVGADLTADQGKEAARQTGLAVLSTIRQHLGSLDRVGRLVRTLGLVQCTADFREQPFVINGFSELMAEVFGDEAGVGVRSAVGAVALPANIAVEVECTFEVAP